MQLRRLSSRHRRGENLDGTEIDAAVAEAEAAMAELRALAHGIYPPLLELRGLPDALAVVARRSASAITLEAGPVGRFDRTLETTVYFCCSEALQNIDKHASGAEVTVSLDYDDARGLTLRITDDGPGFDAATAHQSRGLVNMADRVGSAGGALRVESTPGHGTVITASFPDATQRSDDVEVSP